MNRNGRPILAAGALAAASLALLALNGRGPEAPGGEAGHETGAAGRGIAAVCARPAPCIF